MLPFCKVHRLDPPENCDLAQHNFCTVLTFSHDCAIFAVEHNFDTTLATFVSFEVARIQTLTVVRCDVVRYCCTIYVINIKTCLYSPYYFVSQFVY